MTPKTRQILFGILGLLIIIGILAVGILLFVAAWHRFVALNANLAVGLLTAGATILAATSTITIGRYLERRKEVEAHYREKKTVIYDAFLKEFFKVYYSDNSENVDIVPFLRDWQRQIILWGGANVLTTFLKWRANLGKGKPDAQSMFLMEDFFRALRQDLGLSNRGLERGSFIRLILKNPDLFFYLAQGNPNVTLEEMSKKEKELGLLD